MKGDNIIRLSPEALKAINEYMKLYNIKDKREAAEKALIEAWHREMFIKYFVEHRDATKEEPACLRRILYLGKFYCCKHAPKTYEIITLDVCKACKFKVIDKWQIKAKMDVTIPSSLGQAKTKPIHEVKCDQLKMYVRKFRCDQCPTPCEKKALFT